MKKSSHRLISRYYIFFTTIMLGTASIISPVSATEYVTVAGSQIILQNVTGVLPPVGNGGYSGFSPGGTSNAPLLGGFSNNFGSCNNVTNVINVDGWRGVKLNTQNIIAGFTGSISGGQVTIKQESFGAQQTFSGGLIFDARGSATALGDVEQSSANNLCGGFTAPYGDVTYIRDNLLAAADNSSWGNKLASVEGIMWIYVPLNTPYGSYPLNAFAISQGPDNSLSSSLPITLMGDTIVVTPPPCTIRTRTDIIFNDSSPATMKVEAPITYQCDSIDTQSELDAYMIVTALNDTPSATELALTIDGNKPGGIVRGYVGVGIESSSANCTDTTNSIMFNSSFNTKLGAVATGTKSIPLVWQLCLQGNETAGVASGSALLEIAYK